MDEIDLLKRELVLENQRCMELYMSKVLEEDSLFTQSVFIEVIIRLNYILQKLNNYCRVTWTDDIQLVGGIKDITDLVNKLRNAICHIDSKLNNLRETTTKLTFNIVRRGFINTVKSGSQKIRNDYNDDIAFYYGEFRIYLKRHIERLVKELPRVIHSLQPIMRISNTISTKTI